jgi:YD repeat-containing protein
MKRRTDVLAASCVISVIAATMSQAAQVETPYTIVNRYDVGGQLTGTISPDPDGEGPLGRAATRNTYGTGETTRPLLMTVEIGELSSFVDERVPPKDWTNFTVFVITQYTYDSYGRKATERLIGTDGQVESLTQYSYDNRNRVHCKAVRMNPDTYSSLPSACTPAAEGAFGPDRITRYSYDILDQVTMEERAVGTALQQAYVTNTYTHRRLDSQTDANGNRTELRYDERMRLKKRVYPSPNGAGAVNEADYNEYDYDKNGNVTLERKRDGRTITNTYDANNRLIFKDLSDNTHSEDVSYNYDLRGLTLSSRFGSDTGQGITNTFDGFGRQTSANTNLGGASRT